MRLLKRLLRAVAFPPWFTWELAAANALVAWEVITPRHRMRPGIIRVPMRSTSDLEVFMLANLISLTPGTLTIEVDPGAEAIYVHALFIASPEDLRRRVRKLEDRILGFLR